MTPFHLRSTTRRRVLEAAAAVAAVGAAATAAASRALGNPAPAAPELPPKAPVATSSSSSELQALLDLSAQEWSRGDIDAFCSHYHDDAVFVAPSGMTKTKQAVLDRYKKKYSTKELMGALSFDVLDIIGGVDAGSIAMRWKLAYPNKPTAEGFSVIGLVKVGGRWLIKHDASL